MGELTYKCTVIFEYLNKCERGTFSAYDYIQKLITTPEKSFATVYRNQRTKALAYQYVSFYTGITVEERIRFHIHFICLFVAPIT